MLTGVLDRCIRFALCNGYRRMTVPRYTGLFGVRRCIYKGITVLSFSAAFASVCKRLPIRYGLYVERKDTYAVMLLIDAPLHAL